MEIISAIEKRRSVRVYRTTPIDAEVRQRIDEFINSVNEESGLCFKMVYDEPTAFTSPISYGKIVNVRNYIVVIGEKGKDFECGYYGEKIVIFLQTLGLNTCWAGISYKKSKVKRIVPKGKKLYLLIAVGYGKHLGNPRKSNTTEEVSSYDITPPDWFFEGVRLALLAPTAINQQKFHFKLLSKTEVLLTRKAGFYSKMDAGIVKYHFEIATPKEVTIIHKI